MGYFHALLRLGMAGAEPALLAAEREQADSAGSQGSLLWETLRLK